MFKAPAPEMKPRSVCPPGTTIGRLYILADIGTQKMEWKGEEKFLRKAIFTFELPLKTKVFKEENGPEPYVVTAEYTLSMSDKANLRAMIEAWLGKKLSKEEASEFDISSLVGKPALITISNETKGDKVYANVVSVAAMMDGMTVPPPVNKPVIYQISDGRGGTFAQLPEWIRKKVEKSMEFTQPLTGTPEDSQADEYAAELERQAKEKNQPY